ncbi:MAG: hypothetical protein Q4G33_01960 [bacterium]|nr:hypothetical protein [bacterium]
MKIKKILAAGMIFAAMTVCTSARASDLPAFPGAEGGGKYTTGARGKSTRSVYHVTNLNSSGTGSFKDAVSKEGRIIVFDVGGTIELNGTLTINKNNLTILGQTAPGDGITFSGGDILIGEGKKNIIMRYLRVRPTDKNGGEPDGIGGRWNSNIIIDHCSMSWSVDEMMTLYAGSSEKATPGSNLTVQNCIAAESLRMSNHFKGAHGYGAIIGGTNSSWLNNLFAHHDSRSPRLDRELQNTDFSNNVIYDWGITNSAYGAEPYSYNNKTQKKSIVNWVNNYYKYGPGTAPKLMSRIFDVSNPEGVSPYSQFYFNGNFVEDSEQVTNNNLSGINNSRYADFLTEAAYMGKYTYEPLTAGEAYKYVLANAGATLPRRDAADARIINDVKNRTGRIINNADEVGGSIKSEPAYKKFEIPEDWKTANSMDNAKETDIVSDGKFAGYTWIEAYINDWTENAEPPSNPMVTVLSPATAAVYDSINGYNVDNGAWRVMKEDETLEYRAVADAVPGTTVQNMELYDGSTLLKTYEGHEINDVISLEEGTHYLTCRAVNNKGEKTQSTTSIVYVDSVNAPENLRYTAIGDTAFEGAGAASVNDEGIYTVSGAGGIYPSSGVSNDSCGFMYRELAGDFDISVKIEEIPKFENYQVSGLMLRAGLEPSAQMAMLADGWIKYGENVRVISRAKSGGKTKETFFSSSSGKVISNLDLYNTQETEYRLPKYLRMTRTGDTITFYVSNGGSSWNDNTRQPMTITLENLPEMVYVGLAADSACGISVKDYFARAKFSDFKLNGTDITEVPLYTAAPAPPEPTAPSTAEPSASPDAEPTKKPENYIFESDNIIHILSDTDAQAYIVYYSENGRLESVRRLDVKMNEEIQAERTSGGKAIVMLWSGQKPLTDKTELY